MDFLPDDDFMSDEEGNENGPQRIFGQGQTQVDASMLNAPKYNTKVTYRDEVPGEENGNVDVGICNRRPLSQQAETYELENFEKRLLVIFNHFKVAGYEPRIGTDKDVAALKKTFEKFEFTVVEKTDLSKAQIIAELNILAETDFTDYGCVIVAVLTHGTEDGELKARDVFYSENEIIKRIKVDRNPSLITKPRIVLIQACRGHDELGGVPVNAPVQPVYKDNTHKDQFYSLPVESDILVMHSSYAGKASHRTADGSWFIQTLCRKINELGYTEDLESILIHMKRAVAIDHGHESYNKARQITEINKQMPVITSTLIRKLYLKNYVHGPGSSI